MPKKTQELEEANAFHVIFPRTQKAKAKERRSFHSKMKSILERDKQALRVKDISVKKDMITLETEEIEIMIGFKKTVTLFLTVSELEKNKTRLNNLANKLVNYLNTVTGEYAKDPRVSLFSTTLRKEGANLSRSFVEETTLARINELAKKTLKPTGIAFEYKSGDHENFILTLHDEKSGSLDLIMSKRDYKGMIPWDFALEEYNNLKEVMNIIGKLAQKEF